MRVHIKKWGNSASIRIPASVLEAASLRVDQEVDVREQDGTVVIEPVRRRKYKIEDLVAGITDENMHELISFGKPVGKEVW